MEIQRKLKSHGAWIGKWTFILAATGSAVGLGNIWGFPYKAGTNGGGAFVLIYLGCILIIGIPIMISEIILGRRSGNSPINAMRFIAIESNRSSSWQIVGWSGIFAGILILSFYSVIAGICLNYIFISATSSGAISSPEQFSNVISSPINLILWHTVFMILTALIVSAGIKDGIGRMVKILMPLLGFLMIFMVIYSIINGDFTSAMSFLFAPDFSNVTSDTLLQAMGQAFFSLSLGMGSIMAYGAYMPKEQKVVGTSFTVASLDTLIAILAGLAIFPIIFAFNLEPNSGPGLVFVSMLSAFNQMQFGQFIGPLFFILLSVAALSSSISLLEPGVAYMSEENILSRKGSAQIISLFVWVLGIGSALSFNIWSDFSLIGGRNFLDSMDFIANQILLPLGGMLIAIFVGWFMKKSLIVDELGPINNYLYVLWRFFVKFIAPACVGYIFYRQFF
ncbi:sodium-dependent transporter [Gammaproteobacteria bacterium]|jgi:NSS family neurotransmitter:Na+ symporter|nr:sodium-dependent transporter [Gammaproteobacteria bacterium]MDA9920444.1 sodium-dependent transporter [Gammaproteobacteria bacterium]MDA9963331.1 sodium-dependent transporter [Gammaproteobacteria bacterium]MDB2448097.1 sodium-dependent transporter [Gammaproteobacteria bacterium]MDB2503798.1 sodium-dependent transporter [Gammaproteobacteria bacterium]